MAGLVAQAESWLKTQQLNDISSDDMLHVKQRGFSDVQIARFTCEFPLQPASRGGFTGLPFSTHAADPCKASCANPHLTTGMPAVLSWIVS
jgi:hypothetical protein